LWLDVFAEEWVLDLWEDADLLSLSLTEVVRPKDRDESREGDETATADK
jgi:hypothetical protein